MLESKWQTALARALRKMGAVVLVKHGNAAEGPGWPDLYVAHREWTGWLELKIEGNGPTPRQTQALRKLREQGVEAHVLTWHEPGRWSLLAPDGETLETSILGGVSGLLPRLAMVRERRACARAREERGT